MLKSELLNLINTMEDTQEVDEVLVATDLFKKGLSLENFKNLVGTDKDFKSFLDSEKDKHSSKAIVTALDNFKAKDMKAIIDAEVSKATGGKQKSALEIRIEELEAKEIAKDKELAAAKRLNKYKDILSEKGLNDFSDNILRFDDDDAINAEIENFNAKFEKAVAKKVEATIKGGSYTPPKNQVQGGAVTKEQFAKMGYSEKVKIFNENPELYEQLK